MLIHIKLTRSRHQPSISGRVHPSIIAGYKPHLNSRPLGPRAHPSMHLRLWRLYEASKIAARKSPSIDHFFGLRIKLDEKESAEGLFTDIYSARLHIRPLQLSPHKTLARQAATGADRRIRCFRVQKDRVTCSAYRVVIGPRHCSNLLCRISPRHYRHIGGVLQSKGRPSSQSDNVL